MILVDTSVWIDHFRRDNRTLGQLLEGGRVWIHEFVIGELACGNLKRRADILYYLTNLPEVRAARHDDVLALVEARRLHGSGLGWMDMHLLASAMIEGLPLWTLDNTLADAARRMRIGAGESDLS